MIRMIRKRQELHVARFRSCRGPGHAGRGVAHELVLEGPAADGDGVVCERSVQTLGDGGQGGGGVGVGGDEEDALVG